MALTDAPQLPIPPVVHAKIYHSKTWDSASTVAPDIQQKPGQGSGDRRGVADVPPPYENLPAYSPTQGLSKAASAIRHLFWFGFLFPPLWIIGASTLLFSAKVPSQSLPIAWITSKNGVPELPSLGSREALEAERLWARRCTWAITILICAVITTLAAIFGERDIAKRLPT